jgi:hypothetical protein
VRGPAGRRRVLAAAARAGPRRACPPERGTGRGAARQAACARGGAVLAIVRVGRGRQEDLLQGRAGHGQVADAQAGRRGLQGVQQVGNGGAAAAAAAAGGQLVHLRRAAAVGAARRGSAASRTRAWQGRPRLGLGHMPPHRADGGGVRLRATDHCAADAGLSRTPAQYGAVHTLPKPTYSHPPTPRTSSAPDHRRRRAPGACAATSRSRPGTSLAAPASAVVTVSVILARRGRVRGRQGQGQGQGQVGRGQRAEPAGAVCCARARACRTGA